jgi:hypothetical protein
VILLWSERGRLWIGCESCCTPKLLRLRDRCDPLFSALEHERPDEHGGEAGNDGDVEQDVQQDHGVQGHFGSFGLVFDGSRTPAAVSIAMGDS